MTCFKARLESPSRACHSSRSFSLDDLTWQGATFWGSVSRALPGHHYQQHTLWSCVTNVCCGPLAVGELRRVKQCEGEASDGFSCFRKPILQKERFPSSYPIGLWAIGWTGRGRLGSVHTAPAVFQQRGRVHTTGKRGSRMPVNAWLNSQNCLSTRCLLIPTRCWKSGDVLTMTVS